MFTLLLFVTILHCKSSLVIVETLSNYVNVFSGNYQNQLIYTPGTKSATKCPAKSVANTKTGLCQVKGLADIHV